MESVHAQGPFTAIFDWRAQLGAAVFTLGRAGVVGLSTRLALWGRPWQAGDAALDYVAADWLRLANQLVTLAIAGGPRPQNTPIEPASIEAALSAAFGPRLPGATFHLPPG